MLHCLEIESVELKRCLLVFALGKDLGEELEDGYDVALKDGVHRSFERMGFIDVSEDVACVVKYNGC